MEESRKLFRNRVRRRGVRIIRLGSTNSWKRSLLFRVGAIAIGVLPFLLFELALWGWGVAECRCGHRSLHRLHRNSPAVCCAMQSGRRVRDRVQSDALVLRGQVPGSQGRERVSCFLHRRVDRPGASFCSRYIVSQVASVAA